MTTRVEKSIEVDVPISTAYNQWTQFEEFPQFMKGVERVTQLSDDRLNWVAEIAGVRREWTAQILEQVPDRRVAWAATEGATNAGTVTFQSLGAERTRVNLLLEYEPEGVLEHIGDKLKIVEQEAEGDLERFKDFIESRGYETGAWRGNIDEGTSGMSSGMGTSGMGTGRGMGTGMGERDLRTGSDLESESDYGTDPRYRRTDDPGYGAGSTRGDL